MKRLVLIVSMLSIAVAAQAQTPVVVAWDASTGTVAGYRVSYGLASRSYSTAVDVGNVTGWTFQQPDAQTYYLAVQAYDGTGGISGFSNEVSTYQTPPPPPPPVLVTMSVLATVSGNSGNYLIVSRLTPIMTGVPVTMILTGPTGKQWTWTVSTDATGSASATAKLKGQPKGKYVVQSSTVVNGQSVTGTVSFSL